MSELYVGLLIQTLRRPDIYGTGGIKSCYGITGDKCTGEVMHPPLYNQHKTTASIRTRTPDTHGGTMNIQCVAFFFFLLYTRYLNEKTVDRIFESKKSGLKRFNKKHTWKRTVLMQSSLSNNGAVSLCVFVGDISCPEEN